MACGRFHMFLKDILTTSYKSVNDELFLFWLRCVAPKENKRTNIVYQLATIAAPATDELFTSRKHRATERGVQRSKEKHNVTAAAATTTAAIGTADEITPTYANKVDNIMEMVLSILLAMAPQSLDKLQATTTTSTTTTTTTAAAPAGRRRDDDARGRAGGRLPRLLGAVHVCRHPAAMRAAWRQRHR